MTYFRLFTLGYSGWTVEEITQVLNLHDALLADIRYKPWSRRADMRHPSLQQTFRGRYAWIKDLGNENYNKDATIKLHHAQRGLIELEGYPRESPVVIMCTCRDLAICHRRVVAELARERLGAEVVHLEKPA